MSISRSFHATRALHAGSLAAALLACAASSPGRPSSAAPPASSTSPAPPASAACRDCDCARESIAALRELPERDWREDFTAAAAFHGAGTYLGKERWSFESFSLVQLQPSPSSYVEALEGARAIAVGDREPGLEQNSAPPPPWSIARGSVSVTGWVEARFSDVAVRGTVNALGGPDGTQSRQGLIARWDRHHEYYWFYVDFAAGRAVIAKQVNGSAAAVPIPGSERDIPGFSRSRPYRLEFRVVGDVLSGKVLAPDGAVLTEAEVRDPTPHPCGIAGVNAELSMAAPFAPLAGSFADVSATSLRRR